MVPTDVENLTFISYAREDADFAMALASDLRKAGVNIWLDRFDIPVGHNWPRAVQQALDSSGRFIIILSPVSVESQNVSAELDFALDEGKEVFPVLYKACRRPFRIRALQYADFDTAYESGLIELVKGLGIQPRRTDSALQNQPASAELSAKVSEENNSSKNVADQKLVHSEVSRPVQNMLEVPPINDISLKQSAGFFRPLEPAPWAKVSEENNNSKNSADQKLVHSEVSQPVQNMPEIPPINDIPLKPKAGFFRPPEPAPWVEILLSRSMFARWQIRLVLVLALLGFFTWLLKYS